VPADHPTTSTAAQTADALDGKGVRDRLMRCFQAVFGTLPAEEISRASVDTVEGWDSVATVTLAAVVEEEFGIQLEPSELEQLTSFGRFLAALQARVRS